MFRFINVLLLLTGLLYSSNILGSNQPNILFIIADDMGVDAIKGFGIGEKHPVTPNLDNLRSAGITFTNVWSTPVCSATRASLMTRKYGYTQWCKYSSWRIKY